MHATVDKTQVHKKKKKNKQKQLELGERYQKFKASSSVEVVRLHSIHTYDLQAHNAHTHTHTSVYTYMCVHARMCYVVCSELGTKKGTQISTHVGTVQRFLLCPLIESLVDTTVVATQRRSELSVAEVHRIHQRHGVHTQLAKESAYLLSKHAQVFAGEIAALDELASVLLHVVECEEITYILQHCVQRATRGYA
jgi:hypothetical protein